MGCITAYANYIGQGCSASASAIQPPRMGIAYAGTPARVNAECLPMAAVAGSYIGSQMRVEASLVCTLADLLYIEVSKDIIWLSPENYFEDYFEITSNTNWKIE